MEEYTAREKLLKARTSLVLEQPFFGCLLLKMEMKEDLSVDTGWVDGVTIGYNPAFIDKLSIGQTKTFLAHECMHIAHGHHIRRGNRDGGDWNDAGDYTINPILDKNGFEPIPGWYLEPSLAENSTETNYRILHKEPPPSSEKGKQAPEPEEGEGEQEEEKDDQKGPAGEDENSDDQKGEEPGDEQGDQPGDEPSEGEGEGDGEPSDQGDEEGDGDGEPQQGDGAPSEGEGKPQDHPKDKGGCGGVRDLPGEMSEAEKDEAEADLAITLSQALNCGKSAGRVPDGVERLVEEMVNPDLDPEEILIHIIQKAVKDDYTWSRPNRKYIGRGLYLPSLHSQKHDDIVFAVDTSGSIDGPALQMVKSVMQRIMDDHGMHLWVVFCDERIQGEAEEYEPGDIMEFEAKGGWGTDFNPVFQWIEEQGLEPTALVYFTDLIASEYCFPKEAPEYPTIWVSTGRTEAPFGEIVMVPEPKA